MRILPLITGLVCVLIAGQADAQSRTPAGKKPRSPDSVYWSGRTEEAVYRWTERDLTATTGASAKLAFSAARSLRKGFEKPDADDGLTRYEVTFWPLSAVGPLLSYERDDYWEGGAHPSGGESFQTIDVRRPGTPLMLTELFDAEQIRHALLSDSVVQHILTREKIAPPPTLDGLVKALANKQFGGDNDGMYSVPQELLSDFAFHHSQDGKVAVRFLLPHGSELYRFRHTQLGILLPMPARWKSAFALAASGNSGAMMQTLQPITRGRKSSLTLIDRAAPLR